MIPKNITNPTWEELGILLGFLTNQISTWLDTHEYDRDPNNNIIIGVQRGGLVPAVHFSNHLNIPMCSVDYSSVKGRGEKAGSHQNSLPVFKDKHIFIVDDIFDSGQTLSEIVEFYSNVEFNNTVTTIVLYYKTNTNPKMDKPGFFAVGLPSTFKQWIQFPFEPQIYS